MCVPITAYRISTHVVICAALWIIWRVTWDMTKPDSGLISSCCFCGIVRVENWKYYSHVSSVSRKSRHDTHKYNTFSRTRRSEGQSTNFKDAQTILTDKFQKTYIWLPRIRLLTNIQLTCSVIYALRNNNQTNEIVSCGIGGEWGRGNGCGIVTYRYRAWHICTIAQQSVVEALDCSCKSSLLWHIPCIHQLDPVDWIASQLWLMRDQWKFHQLQREFPNNDSTRDTKHIEFVRWMDLAIARVPRDNNRPN